MSSLLIDDFGGDMFTVDSKLSGSFNAEELQGLSGRYWCEKIAAYLRLGFETDLLTFRFKW